METIEKLIDLVENTKPKCTLGIDPDVYFKDEDGVIESYGCELTLCWYNQEHELMVTAPYCTICPLYKNSYDIETFAFGGSVLDCQYHININTLTPAEEELLQAVMKTKLYCYDLEQNGCTIDIEHY